VRVLILLVSLTEVGVRFVFLRIRLGAPPELWRRGQWLHESCALILGRLGMRLESRGTRPARGLVCSNHLSYLDILVYAAAMPCVFVAKREIERWPLFGRLARNGGTLFVDRQSRASAEQVAQQTGRALAAGVAVVLFPEGTSTDGGAVLRFHPTLLEPAVQLGAEMTPAAIGYRVPGVEERTMCWYGDAAFLPHLLRTLGRAGVVAAVEFYPESRTYPDRKSAALELHDKVSAMRTRMARIPPE
jgi:1-acyl-sn-glycerol-3-phosphate acyltransferase